MENSNSKIVFVSFATFSALVAFTVSLLLKAFAGAFGIVARMTDTDVVRHGLPIAVGFGLCAFLMLNRRITVWGDEVVAEIKKVVFPSGKDVKAMTIAVLIMVLISSLIVSGFDFLSGYVINQMLK